MQPPFPLFLCFAALVAVILASRVYGRIVGMFAAATCGVSVAYVMPPAFSFQVDSFVDQIALAAYGAVSLLVLTRATRRRAQAAVGAALARLPEWSRTSLAQVVPDVPSLEVSVGEMVLRSSAWQARAAIAEMFQLALEHPDVQKISVYGGRWPGVDRIWVAARYRNLPEEDPCILMSGAKDTCEGITCFDNGYERVYQISLKSS